MGRKKSPHSAEKRQRERAKLRKRQEKAERKKERKEHKDDSEDEGERGSEDGPEPGAAAVPDGEDDTVVEAAAAADTERPSQDPA